MEQFWNKISLTDQCSLLTDFIFYIPWAAVILQPYHKTG